MQRRPWFELHDHPRYPRFLRDMVTDALEHTWNTLGSYACIAPRLRRAVTQSSAMDTGGPCQVVDLCSGGGGPWLSLAPALESPAESAAESGSRRQISVILTDKFPNLPAFARTQAASRGRIRYADRSVDAARVPENLHGFRTIFSSFHHFTPQQARAMLADAFERREGIGVFELAQPRLKTMLLCFAMPALNWLLTPTMRPLGWRRMLWTYLLPIVPFTLWLDGVLSCLRAYSEADLRELVAPLSAPDYAWEVGEAGSGKARVTYLMGSPVQTSTGTPTSAST